MSENFIFPQYMCLLILVYGDNATSNILLFNTLSAHLAPAAYEDVLVVLWREVCGCHKLARVEITIAERFGISKHLHSLSLVLRFRKARDSLEASVICLCSSIMCNLVECLQQLEML